MGTNKLLSGKATVVTGSGIGAASALRFAAAGASVIVADIRVVQAEEIVSEIVARGGVASAVEVDVRHADAVEQMIERCVARFDHQHGVGVRPRG
jgi:NAD(P)-dependent dehydrogenase (short-subunit alcohol dehydrogenase family)